jgi:hypothetical protein
VLKLWGWRGQPGGCVLCRFTDLFLWPLPDFGTPRRQLRLELSSVIAMLVYALIGWGWKADLGALLPRGPVVGVTHTTSTDQRTGPR